MNSTNYFHNYKLDFDWNTTFKSNKLQQYLNIASINRFKFQLFIVFAIMVFYDHIDFKEGITTKSLKVAWGNNSAAKDFIRISQDTKISDEIYKEICEMFEKTENYSWEKLFEGNSLVFNNFEQLTYRENSHLISAKNRAGYTRLFSRKLDEIF